MALTFSSSSSGCSIKLKNETSDPPAPTGRLNSVTSHTVALTSPQRRKQSREYCYEGPVCYQIPPGSHTGSFSRPLASLNTTYYHTGVTAAHEHLRLQLGRSAGRGEGRECQVLWGVEGAGGGDHVLCVVQRTLGGLPTKQCS